MNAVLIGIAGILLLGALASSGVPPTPRLFARLEFDGRGWRWHQVNSLDKTTFGTSVGPTWETQEQAAADARARGFTLL